MGRPRNYELETRNTRAIVERLVAAARTLGRETGKLRFGLPVAYVYNPLEYAWETHEAYLRRYATSRKRVVFFGMNPGPFGMAQTGVPFGEIAAVRDWLGISGKIGKPKIECPKRPVEGFDCARSEVSGSRLWGLFAKRHPKAEDFFEEHFVANYIPLAFMEEGGRNLPPDKFPMAKKLLAVCNRHIEEVVAVLKPEWVVGIGGFAAERAREVFEGKAPVRIGQIPHPSPASPAANRNWAGQAERRLKELGIWK